MDTANSLKDQLRAAQLNIEELKLIREANNEELNALERELSDFTRQKQELMERNHELAEERLSLLDYIDELKANIRENQENSLKFDTNLRELQRKNQILAAELENKRANKDIRMEELVLKYQQALETIQELDKETAVWKKQANEAKKAEEIAKNEAISMEAEWEETKIMLENCQSSLEALQNAYKHLSDQKETVEDRVGDLEKRHLESQRSMDEGKSRQSTAEQQLKARLEKALLDIEELIDERDQLRESMNDAITKCAAAMMTQQTLQTEMEKREKQVDTLVASKALLQKTMSDQVNTMKVQMEALKKENALLKAGKSQT